MVWVLEQQQGECWPKEKKQYQIKTANKWCDINVWGPNCKRFKNFLAVEEASTSSQSATKRRHNSICISIKAAQSSNNRHSRTTRDGHQRVWNSSTSGLRAVAGPAASPDPALSSLLREGSEQIAEAAQVAQQPLKTTAQKHQELYDVDRVSHNRATRAAKVVEPSPTTGEATHALPGLSQKATQKRQGGWASGQTPSSPSPMAGKWLAHQPNLLQKNHLFPSILDGSGNFGGFDQLKQQLQFQQGQSQQPQQASPRGMVGGRAGTPQSPHPLLSPVGHMRMAGPMRPHMAQQQMHPQMVRLPPLLNKKKQKR